MWRLTSVLLLATPWLAHALAPTDSIQDVDRGQSGYLPSHKMDPTVVTSPDFGLLWKNSYDGREKFYAKPLIYTPVSAKTNGGGQLVFLASSENWVRTVDAVTGAAVASRQVQPPFLQSELTTPDGRTCYDIPDYIGVIGTPILDPNSETVYFFSKGYQNGATSGGLLKARYLLYALDVNDLTDKPGFPVLIDGHPADNDVTRYFVAGTALQRPSLSLINGVVYGAFGGHCDFYNYTGFVVGVSTQPYVGVVTIFATEASPGAPAVGPDVYAEDSGRAGIWQSGMAPSTDGNRIFFVTGNGQGPVANNTPRAGHSPWNQLGECAVNLAVGDGGKLTLTDYFQPYEYQALDDVDADFGSGGISLLDPTVFLGTNGVNKLAVTVGKSGKIYVLNADAMGGFKQGPGGADAVLQTLQLNSGVWGGVASYPLEGGYIYTIPLGGPLVAYRFGRDQAGNPLFTQAGQAKENAAGRIGIGIPTVTSNDGQPGSGIVWVIDIDAGMRAYHAVPDGNGALVRINLPATPPFNKFQRPAFGDGRVYLSDNAGNVYCLGSPVHGVLNCTTPSSFGSVVLGTTATQTVSCTALTAIDSLAGLTVSDPTYQVSNDSLPQGPLTENQAFQFPVSWNLTGVSIADAKNVSFGSTTPGIKTGLLTVFSHVASSANLSSTFIGLQGSQVSSGPFLLLTPIQVDFGGVAVGADNSSNMVSSSFNIINLGNQDLTVLGYAFAASLDPTAPSQNASQAGTGTRIGSSLTSKNLPTIGSVIPAGQSVAVSVDFSSSSLGNYQDFLTVWTDGGKGTVLFTASATSPSKGRLTVAAQDGSYVESLALDFGRVQAGTSVSGLIRICNVGGSGLHITKSKPPVAPELHPARPGIDLAEGTSIDPGQCVSGEIDVEGTMGSDPNQAERLITDSWILNVDDPSFGLKVIFLALAFQCGNGGQLASGSGTFSPS
ncbi:MAG: hypothetical protein M1826_006529 [Phylliscum demangeonii]|nr:MAG: hypothetical protein M1826_006529 [Phylliscum demangeonii]